MRPTPIRETGELVLPRETLEESQVPTGTALVVIARAGQILLLDRAQVRRRMEEIGQEMKASLGKALGQTGKDAFFAALSLDEYLGLSEAEEVILWDRLFKEAEEELPIREHNILSDFVPARQKRR